MCSVDSNAVVLRLLFAFFGVVVASTAFAADGWTGPKKGDLDLGVCTGGGKALNGRASIKSTELFITGFRAGKILSNVHGHGIFRGNLEYAVEVIPLFLVFQEETTAGFDVTPLLMKWNFINHEQRPVMFFEFGAGALFTSHQVPAGTSRFNFTPQTGFGFYLSSNSKSAATLEFKYMHISNAGLQSPNPGINSLHVLVGYHWFR